MQREIFIPGNVASGKNSKVWTGRYLVYSKTAQKYLKESEQYWRQSSHQFQKWVRTLSTPYNISFYFIRGSRHRFDYHNVVQLPLDLMQKYHWIEDDCADIVIPIFKGYHYDKDNPGLIISV